VYIHKNLVYSVTINNNHSKGENKMKYFLFPFATIALLLGMLFTGSFNNPSPFESHTVEQASTIQLAEDDEGWDCHTMGGKTCEPSNEKTFYEEEALQVLSTLPIDPLAASGKVGYKYIKTVETTDPELSPSYFAIVSPSNPSLVHIMKADWLTQA
jgi:hypothetical protein